MDTTEFKALEARVMHLARLNMDEEERPNGLLPKEAEEYEKLLDKYDKIIAGDNGIVI